MSKEELIAMLQMLPLEELHRLIMEAGLDSEEVTEPTTWDDLKVNMKKAKKRPSLHDMPAGYRLPKPSKRKMPAYMHDESESGPDIGDF